ncbi:hypothetical protein WSM22_25710 [Cytophagales bacterium WSM2-2]|nr:hypothetical protein WSM22_25710 [Cytophagales bacterium WSM2-2]
MASCQKNATPGPSKPTGSSGLDTVYNPTDPTVAASSGFFLDDWQPRQFVAPSNILGTITTSTPTDTINVDMNKVITKIPKYIFGNNANQWMGPIITQPDLMGYLKDLNPNVLRFPGGSISDVYFWNAAVNTPPSDAATTLYNNDLSAKTVAVSDYWCGTNPGNWTITLDNYYTLLQQTHSAGMITVNYGYARYGKGPTPVQTAAHLAAQWVRYDKGRTKFWEIGNESGGTWEAGYKIKLSDNHDSQPEIISGALYGQHFKVFADSMRKAANEVGAVIKIGAQIIGNDAAYSGITDKLWNGGLFAAMGNAADFFIVHNYYAPWHQNSTASVILNTAIAETKAIKAYVTNSAAQSGVQMKPIALTEWNIESEGSKQKVSSVAGIHGVLALCEILNNSIGQAARWDLANAWESGNDHGLFNNSAGSTEPGASPWNPRPVFYYLYYLQKYLGDRLVSTSVSPATSDLSAYASSFTSGEAGVVIVNKGTSAHTAVVNVNHFNPGAKIYWYTLTPGTDNGEFSGQVIVNETNPTGASGGPLNYPTIKAFRAPISSGSFKVGVQPRSVLYVVVDKH